MNTGIQQVLEGFDALPDPEKHQAAVEILRRLAPANEGDLPGDRLGCHCGGTVPSPR